jgi:hypothetical protein
MLDDIIIDYIRQREKQKREEIRPQLELPLPPPPPRTPAPKEEAKRVIIIDTVEEDVSDDFIIDL